MQKRTRMTGSVGVTAIIINNQLLELSVWMSEIVAFFWGSIVVFSRDCNDRAKSENWLIRYVELTGVGAPIDLDRVGCRIDVAKRSCSII